MKRCLKEKVLHADWKAYYEKEAEFKRFNPKDSPPVMTRIELVFELLPSDVNSVLDVGCGDGYLCNELSKKGIGKVEGIDISLNRVKRASELYKGCKFKEADICNIPYPDNFFDLVTCTEVLEHVDNIEKAIEELKRVSKRYIIATVPNGWPIQKVVCPHCLKEYFFDGHIHYFDRQRLTSLFKAMKVIRLRESYKLSLSLFSNRHLFYVPRILSSNWHIYHFLMALSNRFLTIKGKVGCYLGIVAEKA